MDFMQVFDYGYRFAFVCVAMDSEILEFADQLFFVGRYPNRKGSKNADRNGSYGKGYDWDN